MVILEVIRKLLNKRLNKVLGYAEAVLPEKNYRSFRKLILDEFGNGELPPN